MKEKRNRTRKREEKRGKKCITIDHRNNERKKDGRKEREKETNL